eukprot:316776-Chlamydomonas_euryale.AAC.1
MHVAWLSHGCRTVGAQLSCHDCCTVGAQSSFHFRKAVAQLSGSCRKVVQPGGMGRRVRDTSRLAHA